LVNKPFQPEYPGDRQWNRHAAQFKFLPTQDKEDLSYPTWSKILNHCGAGLNAAIKVDPWCKTNGILTGGDYLKCWIASMFQEPLAHLPYLFFYGPQNSGKSIFHEALNLLLTRGYKRADAALINQAGFNAELEGSILCVVEETNLHKNRVAYNRIKDWVTSLELLIHCKGRTPYHTPNSCHWVQCSNEHTSCPVFTGDTRITMCYVNSLDPLELIPKKELIPRLEKEAPDFIAEVIRLELPPSPDRLNIPIIQTQDKSLIQTANLTPLESFIKEECLAVDGRHIKYTNLYNAYAKWTELNGEVTVSKKKFSKEMPPQYPKGRMHGTGQFHLGNIWWREQEPTEPAGTKWILRGEYLERS
jgi:phage/plasmid-associated DNA primase